jgi:hypothetical protein
MALLQEGQIALESRCAFKSFNLLFHDGNVRRQRKRRVIVKMDLVVRVTLDQFDALSLKRGAQVLKGFVEKARQQQ